MTRSVAPQDLTPVRFVVPGTPQGKGRPIAGMGFHGRPTLRTPAKTAAYEGVIALAAQQAMAGRAPMSFPCMVELRIIVCPPASWSKKRQTAALAGQVVPTKKPDLDNVCKALFDGMNGVVWVDDVQAVDVTARKRYGSTPGVDVLVTPMPTEGA
ncbi:RusA family crossover junction endodeoxyribonuclease [Derxia gummosa]|uniref:RusA family crossover junction endodeoxyribonuclease n=1 Tax=Derxia gummosa DSM 723 TaxID=1121388 RepID=A0A8B6X2Q7_9BURK|nr:RusA family crossover junction endodeoxyribonuclease [Derxia gummosa]